MTILYEEPKEPDVEKILEEAETVTLEVQAELVHYLGTEDDGWEDTDYTWDASDMDCGLTSRVTFEVTIRKDILEQTDDYLLPYYATPTYRVTKITQTTP